MPARRGWLAGLGLLPFGAYVVIFLALPTLLAVGTGFFDADGAVTLDNVAALGDPVVLQTFGNTLWLSLITSVVGAVIGALVCYALVGTKPAGALRSFVDAASGVLAQFAGVMLAFAFIAVIGAQGVVTLLLADAGIDIYSGGIWLYDLPGLILPYLYFQIPLMVITFLPALEGLKPQWAEANSTLGGSALSFWTRIGIPVLAPSFFGSLLLLFANAFSAYGTAAALISQGSPIVPLQIRGALSSEVLLGRANLAGALALGMIVIMAIVMGAYALLQRRASRWQR
ncbi:ABC transporter permease [Amnibacterium flavum]|uniref:ABC transporter permease n=1 Tax=Amnibacterium flavum TaxID=2173173 RepID=A0A2V1HMK6_9MICO|nr:ABC transporter permease [Amnibacterium flavum]PVZ93705.1 ABC transporter permease [Amnibacterium flavum]